jgi:hypothetical protein
MNIIIELTHSQLAELEAGDQKLFNAHGTHQIYWDTAPRAAKDQSIATVTDFECRGNDYSPTGFTPDAIFTADVHVFRARQSTSPQKSQRRRR